MYQKRNVFLIKLASYRVVSERSKGRGLGPRCRRFESCLLDLLKLWKCGNDVELRQTVNLSPFGLGSSNLSASTKSVNNVITPHKFPAVGEGTPIFII